MCTASAAPEVSATVRVASTAVPRWIRVTCVARVHRDRLVQRRLWKLDVVDRDHVARPEVGDLEGQLGDLLAEQLQLASRLGPALGIPAIAGIAQELR